MRSLIFLALLQAAYGQSNLTCNDTTVADYVVVDPQTSIAAAGMQRLGLYEVLSNRTVNSTLFTVENDKIISAGLAYLTAATSSNLQQVAQPGSGIAAELETYMIVQGSLSPDDLVEARFINSVLGQAKGQDFVFTVDRDAATGDLLISSMLPNNTGRVIEARETCNGWAYKVDKVLFPAPYHTDFFNSSLDVPIVKEVLLNGDKCSETLPQATARITNATEWPAAWKTLGLEPALADDTLVATVFVPQDTAVAKNVSLETVLYNMVPGQFCPDHFLTMGSMNSMLGVLTGRNLPLEFSNDTGVFTIKGATNIAQTLDVTRACNSMVYATDAVLVPPPLTTALSQPAVFPRSFNRYLTCVPPTMPEGDRPAQGAFPAPAAAATPPPEDSGSGNTALAIGIGVGLGCAAIIAATAAFVVVRRKRRRAAAAPSPAKEALLPFRDGLHGGVNPSTFVPATTVFDPSESDESDTARIATNADADGAKPRSASSDPQDMWEINPSDLEIALGPDGAPIELGRGSFGAVYRGLLRGVQPAAIKVLAVTRNAEYEAAVQKEVLILKRVNCDRNVVQLYGTARMPDGKLLMVTEFMEGGDLRAALTEVDSSEHLAWHRGGKRVALDIACGLTSLHSNRVVHRDLKSKNILLTKDMTAKIADVGIAAVLEASKGYLTPSSGGVIGTLAWSAPELLLGEKCTEKVDIYSLGIILWELGTGAVPQRGLTEAPPPSERCPAELAQLIADCTRYEPERRPSAREVYERILAIPPVAEV